MKKLFLLLSVLVAGSLSAQDPKPGPPMKAENIPQRRDTLLTPKLSQPNEIVHRQFTYSGVLVQIAKSSEPAQLVNPFAPAEYGTGYENNDRDIITHESNGIKLFSIHF
jgi:hypothetical protein